MSFGCAAKCVWGLCWILTCRIRCAVHNTTPAANLPHLPSFECAQITNLKINCTDVVLLKASDAEELQRTLYCGYFQARCTGSSAPNAYAAAFDWRDTGATKFAPDMLYNDTYAMKEESSTVHAAYQRLPQVWQGKADAVCMDAWPLLLPQEGWLSCLLICMDKRIGLEGACNA